MLRRGKGDLHQQGDADRGIGAIEDEGDVGDKQTVMVCLLTYISTHRTTVEFLLL